MFYEHQIQIFTNSGYTNERQVIYGIVSFFTNYSENYVENCILFVRIEFGLRLDR